VTLDETEITLWMTRREACQRDMARLIRGARHGLLYYLTPSRDANALQSAIEGLVEDGLWSQGVVVERRGTTTTVTGHEREFVKLDDRFERPRSASLLVDPFGSHPVIITAADEGELLVIENAAGLAAEYAV